MQSQFNNGQGDYDELPVLHYLFLIEVRQYVSFEDTFQINMMIHPAYKYVQKLHGGSYTKKDEHSYNWDWILGVTTA